MATAQKALKIYLPRDEAAVFERLVAEKDATVAAVVRRLIREYIKAAA